ncbi:ribonuclease HII [Virgibacillus sp. W0430]|uniref:ribonuclease HII n=1 Tax=Virgibacillus sp. W0430 TaxID=3391580 RepID=UPI003F4493E9
MKKRSIAELRQLFASEKITEHLLESLRKDERKGVQQLIRGYLRKQQKLQEAEKMFVAMSHYEHEGYLQQYKWIAGVDEAGRGPLAGPVVAAAVILPRDFKLLGLTDSKKLTRQERLTFFEIIKQQAISYGISMISNKEIDEINIFQATKQAMYNAINQLNPRPNYVLLDAIRLEKLPYPTRSIIKGDQKSISIAAASILAKVTRDKWMEKLDKDYPQYAFSSHMGYGTKQHIKLLNEHGATPYHRKSYAPVQAAIRRSIGGDTCANT